MSKINKADLLKSASSLKEKNEVKKVIKENIFITIPRTKTKFEFKEPSKSSVDEFYETCKGNNNLKKEECVCDIFLESCTFNFNDEELKKELSESLGKKIITEHDTLRHILVFDEIDKVVGILLQHYEFI